MQWTNEGRQQVQRAGSGRRLIFRAHPEKMSELSRQRGRRNGRWARAHQDVLGANPGKQRSRCQRCFAMGNANADWMLDKSNPSYQGDAKGAA